MKQKNIKVYSSEKEMYEDLGFKEKIGYWLAKIFPFPPFKIKLCQGLP